MAAMGFGRVAAGVGRTLFWLGAETGRPAPVGRLDPLPPPGFPDISVREILCSVCIAPRILMFICSLNHWAPDCKTSL